MSGASFFRKHPFDPLGTGSRRTLAPAFVFGQGQLILPAFAPDAPYAPYARGVRVRPDGSSAVYAIKMTR